MANHRVRLTKASETMRTARTSPSDRAEDSVRVTITTLADLLLLETGSEVGADSDAPRGFGDMRQEAGSGIADDGEAFGGSFGMQPT